MIVEPLTELVAPVAAFSLIQVGVVLGVNAV
jgi:hypothetical protein